MIQANKHQRLAPFMIGDLLFVLTKNISITEGKAHKIAPKYIGPYRIEQVIKAGATYRIELLQEMRRRGTCANFHMSLLDCCDPLFSFFHIARYAQVLDLWLSHDIR